MFEDEEDEFLFGPPPPSRLRRAATLFGFALLMSVAGVITWCALPASVTRSDPAHARELPPGGGELQLHPEYKELRRQARRGLDDVEVARAIERSQHRDPDARREALERLALVRRSHLRSEAVAAVVLSLRDDDRGVRLAALDALGEMQAREHERDVRERLASDDERTRVAARRSLELMHQPAEGRAAHR